jgi:hypothetical protein
MKRTTIVSPGHVLSIIERDFIKNLEHTIIALLSKFYKKKTYLDQREPVRPEGTKKSKGIKRKERERKG